MGRVARRSVWQKQPSGSPPRGFDADQNFRRQCAAAALPPREKETGLQGSGRRLCQAWLAFPCGLTVKTGNAAVAIIAVRLFRSSP